VDTDRNLLFGVLALQLDYIDRDGFVNACAAWATRKDTPLADVLLSLGLLSPDDRTEVERLMERRLKKHGGDVQASLAGAADSAVRSAVAAVGDDDLAQSLPPTPLHGVTFATDYSTQRDGPRYGMIRLAGEGGIGQVWLVRDGSMGRDVALKVLRPDRSDAGYWGRFVREAQVTGQLEHPGIVPVYEVGHRPDDNQPFYTMRFVRGRTLKDAVAAYHERRKRGEAGPLELRELLGAFVQVCQAVGYAHSRGVLHRDLKPANVALGDYGEVMVLDWGLAKLLPEPGASAGAEPEGAESSTAPAPVAVDIEQEATQPGSVLGTPAYMAPEQAEGRLDLMDARMDVYGLGAILYHLLTGNAPFTGQDTPEVLDQVRHNPPQRPREVVGDTPLALEAVCLKALAKKREDRYPSAKALVEELRRWLADEPVSAYRDPLTVRLTRWGRRHRTAVTTAAVLLLTMTMALVVGLVVVNAEKDRTAEARRKPQEALDQVTQEQEKTREALIAKTAALGRSEKAEKSATTQRQLALKTVRDVVGDIRARLQGQPAQQELRKALLSRAEAGLKEVAREADTAMAIDHETIWVHFELGDIFLELEQGGSAEARKRYEKAHDLARQVWEANPDSVEAQRDLSVSHEKLGDVYLRLGDSQAALDSYKKALEIDQRLADADKASAQAQRDLSVSLSKLGNVYLRLWDSQAALDSYQKALEVRQRLADADKTSAQAQRDLSVSHNRLGDVYLELGDSKAALDSYKKGLEIRQRLPDADKTSAQAQRDLSISHEKLGDVYVQVGDNEAALDRYRSCHAIRERLADADKTSALVQRDLSVSHNRLGDVYLELGDSKAALDSYKKALEVRQRLADADKTSAQAQRDLIVSFFKLGNIAEQSYDFKKAQGWYGQGLDVSKRFAKPEVFKKEVALGEARGRICLASEQAVADPATAIKQPDDLRGPVLAFATFALAKKERQAAKAAAAADLLADNARGPDDLYNAACGYALCVSLADKPETREKYAARAIELLGKAVAKGYKDAAHMKKDTDLDALRQRDDFKKLLADLEAATKPKDKKEP
jgi:serine/threonine protein kinase/tetratricopeptide (TPR) repeat protein